MLVAEVDGPLGIERNVSFGSQQPAQVLLETTAEALEKSHKETKAARRRIDHLEVMRCLVVLRCRVLMCIWLLQCIVEGPSKASNSQWLRGVII